MSDADLPKNRPPPGSFADAQTADLPQILQFLGEFWPSYRNGSISGRVTPEHSVIELIKKVRLPQDGESLPTLLEEVRQVLDAFSVRTSSPSFMGYVTPPSTEIGALGDALAALTNQNVSFATLSPVGTALESVAVSWLNEIVGFPIGSSGLLTSGGSESNMMAVAMARRWKIGGNFNTNGTSGIGRAFRVYCSDETHHSIDKAAAILGIGSDNVVRIPTGSDHKIDLDQLDQHIMSDVDSCKYLPLAIIGNAGTRMCCAFDDLRPMKNIADRHGLWLHVDAAYGGFLRLAPSPPEGVEDLHLADSVTIDPHKLLFTPYDCGALLVKSQRDLANVFGGSEGEYLEPVTSGGLVNYANLGIQLGRSMRGLKVWLTIRRFGAKALGEEYGRLMSLARYLRDLVNSSPDLELLGPVSGTAVCFRWNGTHHIDRLNAVNANIRRSIVQEATAFVDEISIGGRVGLRACMTNFRTTEQELDRLIEGVRYFSRGLH